MQQVTRQAETQEDKAAFSFSPALTAAAHFFTYILHPLFIPLYGTLLVVYAYPYHFADFNGMLRFRILGAVILNTIIFPAVTVFLLKKLDFIGSVHMRTRRDRIIPYAASMIFYFWVFYVFRHQEDIPVMLTAFLLGNFITIIGAFLLNIFMKVSMHMMGMGGLLGVALTMGGNRFFNASLPLMLIILLTGAVATSRLILHAHRERELYWGLMLGVVAQLLAVWIV